MPRLDKGKFTPETWWINGPVEIFIFNSYFPDTHRIIYLCFKPLIFCIFGSSIPSKRIQVQMVWVCNTGNKYKTEEDGPSGVAHPYTPAKWEEKIVAWGFSHLLCPKYIEWQEMYSWFHAAILFWEKGERIFFIVLGTQKIINNRKSQSF